MKEAEAFGTGSGVSGFTGTNIGSNEAFKASRRDNPDLAHDTFKDLIHKDPDLAMLEIIRAKGSIEYGGHAVQTSMDGVLAVMWAEKRRYEVLQLEADLSIDNHEESAPVEFGVLSQENIVQAIHPDNSTKKRRHLLPFGRGRLGKSKEEHKARHPARGLSIGSAALIGFSMFFPRRKNKDKYL